ncbi:hypothetical protein ACKAV7_013098 [Fusarium commune]
MGEFTVIIIGAGLAGPLLANGLLAAGINVQLHEKLSPNAKRDGFQIRMARPAFRAFDACLDSSLVKEIRARAGHFEGQKSTAPILYDPQFRPLFDFARYNANYEGSAPIDRVVLRNFLMERPLKAGIVEHDKRFSHYEIIDSGQKTERVRAWFEDGTSTDGDILIAADGSHSKINEQIGLRNLEYVSHMVFICKGQLTPKMQNDLPLECWKSPVFVSAENKCFFCVAYLPNDYDDSSAAAFSGATGKILSSFTFAVTIDKSTVPAEVPSWSLEEQWKFVTQSVQHWDPKYLPATNPIFPQSSQIIEAVRGEQLHIYTPRVGKRPPANWRSKVQTKQDPALGHPRVWLLGDALHCMLPNRGMGGNQAMQDSAMAVPLLAHLDQISREQDHVPSQDIMTLCREFEAEMVPRAFEWVERSGGLRPTGLDTSTMSGKAAVFFMNSSATLLQFWKFLSSFISSSEEKLKSE